MKRAGVSLIFVFTLSTPLVANRLSTSYKLEAQGKYNSALKKIESLALKNKDTYFLQLRAGWLAYLSGQMSKSSGFYSRAIELEPGAIEPRIGQLLPLIALGKYRQAQAVARKILRRDKKNYTARSRMAYALFLAGQYKKAQRYYNSLVKDYPADGDMLIGLGWSQLRRGKKKDALETFQKAKSILPNNKKVAEGIRYARR